MKDILILYDEISLNDNASKDLISQRLIKTENNIGKKLPESYKQFLLKYKGGGVPSLFNFKLSPVLNEGRNVKGSDFLSGCFWLSYIHSSKDIIDTKLLNHPALKKLDLFDFAYDVADNLICISLAPKTYGKIYWWGIDEAPPDEDEEDYEECEYYDNIYYFCNSFEEFIDRLTDSSEYK